MHANGIKITVLIKMISRIISQQNEAIHVTIWCQNGAVVTYNTMTLRHV